MYILWIYKDCVIWNNIYTRRFVTVVIVGRFSVPDLRDYMDKTWNVLVINVLVCITAQNLHNERASYVFALLQFEEDIFRRVNHYQNFSLLTNKGITKIERNIKLVRVHPFCAFHCFPPFPSNWALCFLCRSLKWLTFFPRIYNIYWGEYTSWNCIKNDPITAVLFDVLRPYTAHYMYVVCST